MQKSKKYRIIRYSLLIIGLLEFILPGINTEDDLLYVVSPWIYIACFLFFIRTIEKKRDWFLVSIIYLMGYEIRYRGFLGGVSIYYDLISAALIAWVAFATFVPFLVDRFYLKKGNKSFCFGVLTVMAFPITRIIMESLIIGKQFNLSLTQFGNKPLIQSVSVFGDVFISFVVAFIPAVIIYIFLKKDSKRMRLCGLTALSIFIAIMICGTVRFLLAMGTEEGIPMAYASGPQKTCYEDPSPEDPDMNDNITYLTRTVEEASANGAKLIAYAEEAYIVSEKEEEDLMEYAQELAKENDIFILMSLDVSYGDEYLLNKAALISNEGEYLSSYLKTNLIPVVEDEYTAGDGVIPCDQVTIDGQECMVSYTICYDATFSEYLLDMDNRTNLFINPSWDWEEIVDLNYRMQGISAIENGVALFKPTVDGWSIVTDPYGDVSYKESTLGKDYNNVFYTEVFTGKAIAVYEKLRIFVKIIWVLFGVVLLLDILWIIRKMLIERKHRKAENGAKDVKEVKDENDTQVE